MGILTSCVLKYIYNHALESQILNRTKDSITQCTILSVSSISSLHLPFLSKISSFRVWPRTGQTEFSDT